MTIGKQGIGNSLPRREDAKLLTGAGNFIDDLNLEHQTYAWFVRSTYAHASIKAIDTTDAMALDGVLAVITGADLEPENLGRLDGSCSVTDKSGAPVRIPQWRALAVERVRHLGDGVAMVIAQTPEQARAGAELVEVDYEERPCVVDAVTAAGDNAPVLFDDFGTNTAFEWERGEKLKVDKIFSQAAHITRVNLTHNRVIVAAMEPRGALAVYDAANDHYTLYTPTQGASMVHPRLAIALGVDESQVRVVTPDVGGAFGIKALIYPEQFLCAYAARRVGRPVKWYADRSDSFFTDYHARDHFMEGELALDSNGRFLAIRSRVVSNMGAYLTGAAPIIPTAGGTRLLPNVYRIDHIYAHTTCVYTNTVPIGAYRGAGKPEYLHLVERLVDQAARDLDLDPAEIRRRNLISPQELPYTTPTGLIYDSGDFDDNMTQALELMTREGFESRRADALRRGRLLGFGFSVYTEPDGFMDNRVTMAFQSDGQLTVTTTAQCIGQGVETTLGQIATTLLGVPADGVTLLQGDTDIIGPGNGSGGSRVTTVSGAAMFQCAETLIEEGRDLAAGMLEVASVDIEFSEGRFVVVGTDRSISIQDVARRVSRSETDPPPMVSACHHKAVAYSYPNGCHVCEVSIDIETGDITLERYGLVGDYGVVVNPMLLEGQLHGGIVQGIGQVVWEDAVYDPGSGQLLSGSFMDYCLPRASHLPFIEWGLSETICTTNPLGVKGCGESGSTAALPAVMNAVADALRDYDTSGLNMPTTSEKLWRIISTRT